MTAGEPSKAPVVHVVTRKPLTHSSRVFKQAESLLGAGYDVVLLGVRRGPLPASERRGGVMITRVAHDPLPERFSLWLRRSGLSPTTVRRVAATSRAGWADRLRRTALAAAARAGALPWLAQSAAFNVRAYRVLTRSAPPPAVVHASGADTLPVAAVLARRFGVPLVYDAPELFAEMHAVPPSYRRVLAAQERRLMPRVDRLIVVNPMIGNEMRARYGRTPDAVVLNCAPQPAIREGRDLRDVVPVAPGAKVLIYSGGLLPERGVEQALLALHHLPDAELVILGEGALRGPLETLAAEEGLADRAHFLPLLPWEQVTEFIGSADAGVVPYRAAGLNHVLCSPGKLFDYLMAGLPVACSDLPFLRSVALGDGVGTVFDPSDPRSIATAVERLLAEPERYRTRIAKVRSRYSWEHEERAFLGAYASLTLTPRAARRGRHRPR